MLQVKKNRKNFSLEAVFTSIPAPIARDFAAVLREFASFLDENAEDKEAADRKRATLKGELAWMRENVPALMDRAIQTAQNENDAALSVTAKTGIQPATVLYYWNKANKDKKAAALIKRNRRIVARYKMGVAQETIAQEFGISQATVSRAVREAG